MVTAVSGFIEQMGNMIREIPRHNNHPSTPHNSIKLQRASTDTCHQVNLYKQLSSSELDNFQQMDAYELVFIG